ncbi:MAG TPA: amidophosphoribosyltransferase [Vicinamibacterales bacterium]|nr:amidophosphoribosyltransferase [Vicinamibacterales bacterium]
MGGFFGVVSRHDCVADLFYGTDYHSHLGTSRGGMVVRNGNGFKRNIHDISGTPFRSKFSEDLPKYDGGSGIGVISDNEDQPLLIASHHGSYAVVTVGRIENVDELARQTLQSRAVHYSELKGNAFNPTEVVATIINGQGSLVEGLREVQARVLGSCSVLLLTDHGLYAARDAFGRTSVTLGRKDDAWAVTMETCALPNLGYEVERHLGPGEIVRVTAEGHETLAAPGDRMQVCAFLWIYYGYPASNYEGINTEVARYRCGEALARADATRPDLVAGIPDSGIGAAIGYAAEAGVPYRRPFVKYTPTWPRSFMPQEQRVRDLVARMKLIPIREIIEGRRLLFCEDSIVRGTQLRDLIRRVFDAGAREVHMRPACPPLVYGCRFLNFSQSRSELDLAARRAVTALEGRADARLEEYADPATDRHCAMVEWIRRSLGLTTLQYQRLGDMVAAIGLPRERLCTYCWTGDAPFGVNAGGFSAAAPDRSSG